VQFLFHLNDLAKGDPAQPVWGLDDKRTSPIYFIHDARNLAPTNLAPSYGTGFQPLSENSLKPTRSQGLHPMVQCCQNRAQQVSSVESAARLEFQGRGGVLQPSREIFSAMMHVQSNPHHRTGTPGFHENAADLLAAEQ